MASRKQRAVTDVPLERWAQFGRALWDWREQELGYNVRGEFAADRGINIRLVQDLENNYRQTYTRYKLQHEAAPAYEITYESMLAYLHGETDKFTRPEPEPEPAAPPSGPESPEPEPPAPRPLPQPPPGQVNDSAVRPYFIALFRRVIQLEARGNYDPSAADLGLSGHDAEAWNGTARAGWTTDDRAWLVADLQCRRAARTSSAKENGAGA